jgi:hypothetical protein
MPAHAAVDAPTVTTAPPADITNSSARLVGSLDPHATAASYTFRWGLSAAFYAQWTPVQDATWDGERPVDARISGLAPDTTFHYALVAVGQNDSDPVIGRDQSFTTLPLPPLAADATGVTTGSATLNGETVGGGSGQLVWWFEYGTTSEYGSATLRAPAGNGARAVSAAIDGLAAGVTYHYRLVVGNGNATQPASTDRTFVTRPVQAPSVPPRAATLPAADVTDTSAVLQGSVDALGLTGTYQFEYGSTAAYGARTAAQPLGAGQQTVSAPVDGLRPFQTYHYRLLVTTALGTVSGPDAQLTTRGDVRDPKVAIDVPSCRHRPARHSCDGWRRSAAAWRTLTGTAVDDARGYASGLDAVRIRLVRRSAKVCRALAGKVMVRRSCALAARSWVVAWRNQREWMLDLPRLARGTYQLTVRASDRAGNAEDAALTLRIRS